VTRGNVKQENLIVSTELALNVSMAEKCISQFNEAEESWKSYTERLEQYFMLNGTTNEKKESLSALLTFLGPKTY